MLAACINVDITWSDASRTLCVNTVLFKQTLQPYQKLWWSSVTWLGRGVKAYCTILLYTVLWFYFSSLSHTGRKEVKRLCPVKIWKPGTQKVLLILILIKNLTKNIIVPVNSILVLVHKGENHADKHVCKKKYFNVYQIFKQLSMCDILY